MGGGEAGRVDRAGKGIRESQVSVGVWHMYTYVSVLYILARFITSYYSPLPPTFCLATMEEVPNHLLRQVLRSSHIVRAASDEARILVPDEAWRRSESLVPRYGKDPKFWWPKYHQQLLTEVRNHFYKKHSKTPPWKKNEKKTCLPKSHSCRIPEDNRMMLQAAANHTGNVLHRYTWINSLNLEPITSVFVFNRFNSTTQLRNKYTAQRCRKPHAKMTLGFLFWSDAPSRCRGRAHRDTAQSAGRFPANCACSQWHSCVVVSWESICGLSTPTDLKQKKAWSGCLCIRNMLQLQIKTCVRLHWSYQQKHQPAKS